MVYNAHNLCATNKIYYHKSLLRKYITYYRKAAPTNYEQQLSVCRRVVELERQLIDSQRVEAAELQYVYHLALLPKVVFR